MKPAITITALLFILCNNFIHAQFGPQFNNFDSDATLDIMIDSLSADTIWQIGIPQKTNLNVTSSQPNALMTDTLNTYPINTNASFVVKLDEYALSFFPFIQLDWFHKTDFEDGADGGIIEVSYDNGITWSNVFSDSIYRPFVVGQYQLDTLHNQEVGVSGTSDLSYMAICWGTPIGTQPDDIESVHVRFTMTTDSVDTNQDGWLIDDLYVSVNVIGNTSNSIEYKDLTIIPNPARDEIQIQLDDMINEEVDIYIYDAGGRMVYSKRTPWYGETSQSVNISNFQSGMYYLTLEDEGVAYRQKFIKLE